MKDSLRSLVWLMLLALAVPVSAQKEKTIQPPAAIPTAKDRLEKPVQYEDSAEFAKTFKEFYPLVKPKSTVRELAEKQVDRQIGVFIKMGADSLEILKVVYVGLDEDAAYKIYYDTYRKKLTAKELKAYTAFLRTPEGAKIQSVSQELSRAPSDVTNYITKTVTTNLMPISTTLREKSLKAQKERDLKMQTDTTDAGKQYRMQTHMRDSILNARGIDTKK